MFTSVETIRPGQKRGRGRVCEHHVPLTKTVLEKKKHHHPAGCQLRMTMETSLTQFRMNLSTLPLVFRSVVSSFSSLQIQILSLTFRSMAFGRCLQSTM